MNLHKFKRINMNSEKCQHGRNFNSCNIKVLHLNSGNIVDIYLGIIYFLSSNSSFDNLSPQTLISHSRLFIKGYFPPGDLGKQFTTTHIHAALLDRRRGLPSRL